MSADRNYVIVSKWLSYCLSRSILLGRAPAPRAASPGEKHCRRIRRSFLRRAEPLLGTEPSVLRYRAATVDGAVTTAGAGPSAARLPRDFGNDAGVDSTRAVVSGGPSCKGDLARLLAGGSVYHKGWLSTQGERRAGRRPSRS